MPGPGSPPARWMCPTCRGIIEEETYFALPRRLVRGPGGKYTKVECPTCHQQTVAAAWTVVEITGAEEIA